MNEADLKKEKGGAVLWQRKGGAGDKELEEKRRFLLLKHVLASCRQA